MTRTRVRKKAPSVRWLQRELARVTEDLLGIRRSLEVTSAALRESDERRVGLEVALDLAQGVASDEHRISEARLVELQALRVDIQALRETVRL